MFSIFKNKLNHLKIIDRTQDSQRKFQLLGYQTTLLFQCFAYILEKRTLTGGGGARFHSLHYLNCLTGWAWGADDRPSFLDIHRELNDMFESKSVNEGM